MGDVVVCAWRVSVNRDWFVGQVGRAPGQWGPELPEGRQCPRGPQRRRGAHWRGRCPPDAQVSSTSEATVHQKKKGFCPPLWKTGLRTGTHTRLPGAPTPSPGGPLAAGRGCLSLHPRCCGRWPRPWQPCPAPRRNFPQVGRGLRFLTCRRGVREGISSLSPRGALCPKLRIN